MDGQCPAQHYDTKLTKLLQGQPDIQHGLQHDNYSHLRRVHFYFISGPNFHSCVHRVVKEGGLQTLMGVSTIIVCGALVSNVVCYLFWPQLATHNLQNNMTKTLDSFSTLLSTLTKGFLLENENFIQKTGIERVQKAVDDHQSSFTSLKKNLAEAKKEWLDGGERGSVGVLGMVPLSKNRRKRAYEDAVDSLNRLAQHLSGLRSSTRLQYELTKAGVHKVHKGKAIHIADQNIPPDESLMLAAAAEMFGALVDEVGPPLKALLVSQ